MSEDTSSGDDERDEERDEEGPDVTADDVQEGIAKSRERLQEEADRAVEGFDEGIVDLLSWVLDTETRARIYVFLRQHPGSTSEEIAEGTGLYPSTVREALAELAEEEKVTREKRASEGAGNNPYEYEAIAPSELVGGVVNDVQAELNTVFNLDDYLGETEIEPESEPVSITVEDASVDADGDGSATGRDAEADDESAEADGEDAQADDEPEGAGGDDGVAAGSEGGQSTEVDDGGAGADEADGDASVDAGEDA